METQGCRSSAGGAPLPRPPGRARTSASRPDDRHPRHDGAVGHLGHGALAEHPVRARGTRPPGPVSGVGSSSRAGTSRVDVGLPPTPPVRDEAQRPVAVPGRLADRLRRATGDGPRRPRRLERVVAVCRAQATRPSGSDQDGRGIPRHVRVIPGDHGQAVAGRMRPRRPEEIVPVEQRGLARRLAHASRVRPRCAPGPADPSRWISRTASTQSPSAVALSPPWLCTSPAGGAARQRPSAWPPRPRGSGPSQNHTRWSAWST